mmetsp:Transcript_3297/g.7798  ORF Transcript_3297/g.7798 Transcript_3297/m.7798 type:complete len:532 (-) Transcript_3297:124-1719(-)
MEDALRSVLLAAPPVTNLAGMEIPVWIEGALICLFGSTLTALGLVLQKYSHSKAAEKVEDDEVSPVYQASSKAVVATVLEEVEHDEYEDTEPETKAEGPYWKQPWWLLGFSLYIAAQLINMVSMAMTPQVVLSCLGSWTLVCNTMFAHWMLGEQINKYQAIAVVGLIVSTALVLASAPRPSPQEEARKPTVDDLITRFLSTDFGSLTIFAIFLALSARATIMQKNSKKGKHHPFSEASTIAASPQNESVVALAWALCAALCAGYTALLFKCIAVLIAGATLAPVVLLMQWEFYGLLFTALMVAPSELHCLNMALQNGDAVSVVPMYLAMGMLAQLLTGGVFFGEFRDFRSDREMASFAGSVSLTLSSVVFMARAQALTTPEMSEEISEITEVITHPTSTKSAKSKDKDLSNYSQQEVEPEQEKLPQQVVIHIPSSVASNDLQSPLLATTDVDLVAASETFVGNRLPALSTVSMSGFAGAIESLQARREINTKRPLTPEKRSLTRSRSRGHTRTDTPVRERGRPPLFRFTTM